MKTSVDARSHTRPMKIALRRLLPLRRSPFSISVLFAALVSFLIPFFPASDEKSIKFAIYKRSAERRMLSTSRRAER